MHVVCHSGTACMVHVQSVLPLQTGTEGMNMYIPRR
jgi:hypothetical protein